MTCACGTGYSIKLSVQAYCRKNVLLWILLTLSQLEFFARQTKSFGLAGVKL